MRVRRLALAALLLSASHPLYAQQNPTREQNLQTCLSGRYRALCRQDLLSPEERVQVRAAELRENLRICLTGRYPTLCNHSELTPEQAAALRAAERAENLRICMIGRYPTLCRHDLLSSQERARVRDAEAAENLRVCSDARYAVLCRHSLLSRDQAQRVADAEAKAAAAVRSRPPARESGCYQSSIMSPTPFMGNNGEIFRLADGSLWEVKYEYEYMYEYYPAVVVCPSTGKLVVSGKTLNVELIAAARSPSSSEPPVTSTSDVIESRIDGEFSGWEGETIFKLVNGQIWQQSRYAYKYHYAYSPEVLIYRSGSVYKMRVDSVDGEIAVRRLK